MVMLTMPVPQLGLGGRDRGPGVAGGGGGGDSDTVKVGEVPRTSALELSYERFCLDFMEPNRPVILQVIVYCCQADQPRLFPARSRAMLLAASVHGLLGWPSAS